VYPPLLEIHIKIIKILSKRLEVASKPQIRLKGKAQADRESASYMGM
jgi:hypothetical protein